MPKVRIILECACGCGLFFEKGRFTVYSPECKTPPHRRLRYHKGIRKYQSDYKKSQYSKARFKIEPKSKGKFCSCGCGRPVGKGLRMLSSYCYEKGDDQSDMLFQHKRRGRDIRAEDI